MKQIPLTQGQTALVDDEDYVRLIRWKWSAHKNHYGEYRAVRTCCCVDKKHHTIPMQRQIMKCNHNEEVDHINHNTLDNRKSNLRICTRSQNNANKLKQKKYKGIRKNKNCKTYMSRITYNNKEIYLGCYNNKIDAAKAYDQKAKELFGEFATLNFKEY